MDSYQIPQPSNGDTTDPDSVLASVSCPSTTSCVAVGYYDSSGYGEGLIVTGPGG
jgi:hypothetical protein